MPKKLYIVVIFVTALLVFEIVEGNYIAATGSVLLIALLFSRWNSARLLLLGIGHATFLLLLCVTFPAVFPAEFWSFEANFRVGGLNIGGSAAIGAFWLLLLVYTFCISGANVQNYYASKLFPSFKIVHRHKIAITFYLTLGYVLLSLGWVTQHTSNQVMIGSFLDQVQMNFEVINNRFLMSSEKYEKYTSALMDVELEVIEELEPDIVRPDHKKKLLAIRSLAQEIEEKRSITSKAGGTPAAQPPLL